jgi:hypothetical protein
MVRIFARKAQNPPNPSRRRAPPSSTAAHHNWSLGKARGGRKGAVGLLLVAGQPSPWAPTVAEDWSKPATVARTAPVTAATQDPLRWVRHPTPPCRARPHRERLAVALGLPRRSRGHGDTTRGHHATAVADRSCHELSTPWSTTEIRSRGYPFTFLIWAIDHWPDGHRLMKSHGPKRRGPGLRTRDLFHQFFNRKIIH